MHLKMRGSCNCWCTVTSLLATTGRNEWCKWTFILINAFNWFSECLATAPLFLSFSIDSIGFFRNSMAVVWKLMVVSEIGTNWSFPEVECCQLYFVKIDWQCVSHGMAVHGIAMHAWHGNAKWHGFIESKRNYWTFISFRLFWKRNNVQK